MPPESEHRDAEAQRKQQSKEGRGRLHVNASGVLLYQLNTATAYVFISGMVKVTPEPTVVNLRVSRLVESGAISFTSLAVLPDGN